MCGNAKQAYGLERGRGLVARKGVLARSPSSGDGDSALPGNGQASLQKSFGGALVQKKRP